MPLGDAISNAPKFRQQGERKKMIWTGARGSGGQLLERLALTAATAILRFPRRIQECVAFLKKVATLTFKDLDLFASIWIARFIVWRIARKQYGSSLLKPGRF
jgi:hypothetical protein